MTLVRIKDRLRKLVDVLVASLDDPAAGTELARRAHLSRFHFDRLVSAALGESPAAFRRRLLLERSAWELTAGDRSVTELALEAGYGSLEAFTRAFARTYGRSPTAFRALHEAEFRAPAPNGVHFHSPGGLLVPGDDPRRKTMDLTDRLVEHDNALTARLIESATQLSDDALDAPVPLSPPTDSFQEDAPSIRSMLNRLVFTKEMWTAAITGRAFKESDDTSLAGLRARYATAGPEFVQVVRDIRDRGVWDTAFVDATCEPPATFTFGSAVSHVLVRNAYRRQVVAGALRARGVADRSHDPIAWEREQ